MTIVTLGIDLGKTVCSIAGMDAKGHIVVRKRLRRDRVIAFAANLPRCVIAMEACCGAHHIGRRLAEAGHDVRLMPPEYVKPYVKAQKNDALDAEAIAEAATRPTMRFVTLKTQDQLDLQTLHRLRQRLVRARTALINQLRAILLERGHTVAQGRRKLSASLATVLATADLSPRISVLIDDLRQEWRELDRRIEALDRELMGRAREDEAVRRLMTIPGVGVLTATALTAAIGKGEAITKGRHLAAWLGLVPRQASTGGRVKLLAIIKRGNRYLRQLFIHGARAALPHLAARDDAIGSWLRRLLSRVHFNVAVVGLANKLARIAWEVLAKGVVYRPQPAMA